MTLEAQLSEEEEEMFAECQKFDAFLKLLMTLSEHDCAHQPQLPKWIARVKLSLKYTFTKLGIPSGPYFPLGLSVTNVTLQWLDSALACG